MTTLFRPSLEPHHECHVQFVRLRNFKAAADVRLTLGRRLHVLIGDNGAGKTTILRGLALALEELMRFSPIQIGPGMRRLGSDGERAELALDIELGSSSFKTYTHPSKAKLLSIEVGHSATEWFHTLPVMSTRDHRRDCSRSVGGGATTATQQYITLQSVR